VNTHLEKREKAIMISVVYRPYKVYNNAYFNDIREITLSANVIQCVGY
jgi:hypothetical protein